MTLLRHPKKQEARIYSKVGDTAGDLEAERSRGNLVTASQNKSRPVDKHCDKEEKTANIQLLG